MNSSCRREGNRWLANELATLTSPSTWVRYVRTYPGVPPRRRLSDPGVLQRTVTPRRRAQGGDAGSGSYPSLHARRHCSGDSRGRPRHRGSGVRAVARVYQVGGCVLPCSTPRYCPYGRHHWYRWFYPANNKPVWTTIDTYLVWYSYHWYTQEYSGYHWY